MESPAHYPVLCKKALKSALNLHRKQAVVDAVKFRLVVSHSCSVSLWLAMLTGNKVCCLRKVDFGLYARLYFWLASQRTSEYGCLIDVLTAIVHLVYFLKQLHFQ